MTKDLIDPDTQLATLQLTLLEKLRLPFSDKETSHKPMPQCQRDEYNKLPKAQCEICGGYHATSRTTHLTYVGHAALTNRLLLVDPHWTWEPFAVDEFGLPRFDKTGGLWIRLTIAGMTRIGYGNSVDMPYSEIGSREKAVIGDALRNAGMRFGMALELWHKGDLDTTFPVLILPPPETTGTQKKSVKPTDDSSSDGQSPVDTTPAEVGEIAFIKAKFKALKQTTVSDVLSEAGIDRLLGEEYNLMTKPEFAAIKVALKGKK
jgi:hypothetical protein